MTTRIGVMAKDFDARAVVRQKNFGNLGFKKITDLWIIDVYTVDKFFTEKQLVAIASQLSNPVIQDYVFRSEKIKFIPKKKFSFAIEIGFLPGVTDNIAHTTREIIEDKLKLKFNDDEGVYSSQVTFISGSISKTEAEQIAFSLHNPLIQRSHIKIYEQFIKDGGMDMIVPKVKLSKKPEVTTINLNVTDEDLITIGKAGIANSDGTAADLLHLTFSL